VYMPVETALYFCHTAASFVKDKGIYERFDADIMR